MNIKKMVAARQVFSDKFIALTGYPREYANLVFSQVPEAADKPIETAEYLSSFIVSKE